ncbi:MAG: pseudouridine synthase [Christensenellales bacterium]|jgi:16S rRNA pseudouridine516 synthase
MRLDKLLTETGMTRTEAKKAISAGRVLFCGERARNAGLQVAEGDEVLLDGAPVCPRGDIYLMLHKPEGIITATEDPHQETVLSLVPEMYRARGLAPVGRLDKDTTGLLLLTTDGALAHFLISPRRGVEKVYRAHVEGALAEDDIMRMAQGIPLKDFTAKPAKLQILASEKSESVALLTVTEGKYHQVKRMFSALGHPVTKLHRQRVAHLELNGLPVGQIRPLTEDEVRQLKILCKMEREEP